MKKKNIAENNTEDVKAVQYETLNDLPEETRAELINLLNQRLADAIDLQTQAKQAHWNVKGPSFIALHELFDKVNADGDADTADVFTEISRGTDKWLWFVEA